VFAYLVHGEGSGRSEVAPCSVSFQSLEAVQVWHESLGIRTKRFSIAETLLSTFKYCFREILAHRTLYSLKSIYNLWPHQIASD
jgi:hypothetical protein